LQLSMLTIVSLPAAMEEKSYSIPIKIKKYLSPRGQVYNRQYYVRNLKRINKNLVSCLGI